MRSEVKTFSRSNGEIQRVQAVWPKDWSELDFMRLGYDEAALDCFADVYENYLVPACPWIFGNMVMFHIPDDVQTEFPTETKEYGKVGDRLTAATAAMKRGVRIIGGKPVFKNTQVKAFWQKLEERNCIRIISGKLPTTQIIPVGRYSGYLSQTCPDASLKINASFFIMDKFDCATVFDHVGTPFGLCVKNGVVSNPPMFGREALLVKNDGSVTITAPDIYTTEIEIGGRVYKHGKNAIIYSRPDWKRTPRAGGTKLVIIGCSVAAVKKGGRIDVPASGFVLCPLDECSAAPGDNIVYRGMEDVSFGIQAGNSIIRNGVKTERFISRFYNIRRLEKIPFPPSLYPMDFQKARAARIALGADAQGKPMLLWAEGAGKISYTAGKDSTGASLSELADICAEMGMINAVNLDGGGSAQMLVENKRALLISDRNRNDNNEAERPVPLALVIRR